MTDADCKTLAAAVIKQAIEDLKRAKRDKNYSIEAAKQFFRDEWFESLAEIVGLDPEAVRNKLGIK